MVAQAKAVAWMAAQATAKAKTKAMAASSRAALSEAVAAQAKAMAAECPGLHLSGTGETEPGNVGPPQRMMTVAKDVVVEQWRRMTRAVMMTLPVLCCHCFKWDPGSAQVKCWAPNCVHLTCKECSYVHICSELPDHLRHFCVHCADFENDVVKYTDPDFPKTLKEALQKQAYKAVGQFMFAIKEQGITRLDIKFAQDKCLLGLRCGNYEKALKHANHAMQFLSGGPAQTDEERKALVRKSSWNKRHPDRSALREAAIMEESRRWLSSSGVAVSSKALATPSSDALTKEQSSSSSSFCEPDREWYEALSLERKKVEASRTKWNDTGSVWLLECCECHKKAESGLCPARRHSLCLNNRCWFRHTLSRCPWKSNTQEDCHMITSLEGQLVLMKPSCHSPAMNAK